MVNKNNIVFPGVGYAEFVHFLYHVPSQPELLAAEPTKPAVIRPNLSQEAEDKENNRPVTNLKGNQYNALIKQKSMKKRQAEAKQKAVLQQQIDVKRSKSAKPLVPRGPSLVFDDDETWNTNYEALKAYKAKHGNCQVPFGKETGALRSWTERQKKLHVHSKLDEDRFAKMVYVGVEF